MAYKYYPIANGSGISCGIVDRLRESNKDFKFFVMKPSIFLGEFLCATLTEDEAMFICDSLNGLYPTHE